MFVCIIDNEGVKDARRVDSISAREHLKNLPFLVATTALLLLNHFLLAAFVIVLVDSWVSELSIEHFLQSLSAGYSRAAVTFSSVSRQPDTSSLACNFADQPLIPNPQNFANLL